MRGYSWKRQWIWGLGLLAATTLLLTACGDGGSISTGASSVTGSTPASEGPRSDGLHSVEAAKKKNRGKHKGRPEAEVQGVVADKAGTCPTITFTVGGIPVRANGVTEFEGTTCGTLKNGDFVKVEGQPLGNGTILAREVKLKPAPAGLTAAAGITVSLVTSTGTSVASDTTDADGKFEFKDVAPGTYDLKATINGTSCTTPIASGISLTAQRNEVEGKLGKTSNPATCDSLLLVKLEVKQGASKD